jgi:hypothetical protein
MKMSTNTLISRDLLRCAAVLLIAGILITFLAGNSHPAHADPNDHSAAFTEYSEDSDWVLVHLGQFVGMAIIIAGLLAMFSALNIHAGAAELVGKFGVVSAIVALGLYGVLQAVDGVALKQVVDAWAHAPEAEKAARLASAESIRWMEWAIRSYQSFMLGLTFILFAAATVWAARLPKMIGCLMAISGLAYVAQGWVLGVEGFSQTNAIPTITGIVSIVAWSVWLLIFTWQMKESQQPEAYRNSPVQQVQSTRR